LPSQLLGSLEMMTKPAHASGLIRLSADHLVSTRFSQNVLATLIAGRSLHSNPEKPHEEF